MNLDAGQRGALVNEVFPESPAEKAGLLGSTEEITIEGQTANVGGDVITAIDNQPVTDMEDLIAYLGSSTEVGQKVELSFLRDGKPQKVSVTLAARPSSNEQSSSETKPVQRGVTLGITGRTVDESIVQEMDLTNGQKGVLVIEVSPNSLAETAGLRGGKESATINGEQVKIGGDIITALNGQAVNSIEELKAGLGQLSNDQELSLTILRDGTELEITINPAK
jgi:serine protease Do